MASPFDALFEVKKNIPIPEAQNKPKTKTALMAMIDKLEVGDCFDVESSRTSLASDMMRHSGMTKYSHMKFTQRKLTDTSVRIWRTE